MIKKTFEPTFIPFILLLFICCKQQPVFSQKTINYDLVKDFKAVPDDKTDNYQAFAKAAETLSRAGGGHLNIPKGKYYIAAYKTPGADKLLKATDITFKNCKNLSITGNNSIIRVNGNFTRTKDYQLPGLSYYYSNNNTVCPFKFTNCKNVLLKDITLYGEVDKMKKIDGVVEGQSYGVAINDNEPTDESSHIVLQNITAHHFAADGFLIQSNGKDIVMNKCRSYNNARQGLSIVKGNQIKILNSTFDSTANTGAYGWHAPGAGIDVENEFGPGKLTDVLIKNCTFRYNRGFQIVTTLSSDRITIDSCFISDLSEGYSSALNGVGMYSLNSTISNSILFAGIQVDLSDQIYRGTAIQQIKNNIIYSGNRGIVSADFARPVNITGNIFVMLPKPQLDTYFPYIQNHNCVFNNNIIVVHADRVKSEPNKITALIQNCIEAKNDFWLINGYNMPAEKQKDFFFVPAVNNVKNLDNQFFMESTVGNRVAFMSKHIITLPQVKKILSYKMFTAYKQSVFSKKYMNEALAVRKYTEQIIAAEKK
ncbi:MAG TPA: right-handed parallel beta-helix repeat-containing protein [Ferruginibacter sp.]|nr:right-handed parallel beta-helix repeat-containing protein [Ferruginibacter sp.]